MVKILITDSALLVSARVHRIRSQKYNQLYAKLVISFYEVQKHRVHIYKKYTPRPRNRTWERLASCGTARGPPPYEIIIVLLDDVKGRSVSDSVGERCMMIDWIFQGRYQPTALTTWCRVREALSCFLVKDTEYIIVNSFINSSYSNCLIS